MIFNAISGTAGVEVVGPVAGDAVPVPGNGRYSDVLSFKDAALGAGIKAHAMFPVKLVMFKFSELARVNRVTTEPRAFPENPMLPVIGMPLVER